jgi:hypothetical protein
MRVMMVNFKNRLQCQYSEAQQVVASLPKSVNDDRCVTAFLHDTLLQGIGLLSEFMQAPHPSVQMKLSGFVWSN